MTVAGKPHQSTAPLPPALQARLLTAFEHHQRGDFDTADRTYREVLAGAPRCFDALHLLGLVVIQRGRLHDGIALIRRAIEVDSSQPMAHSSLARALIDKRDAAAALAAAELLIELQPSSAEAWLLHGNALQLGGTQESAIVSFERALRLQPDFPAALNNQGHSLRMLRRSGRAIEVLTRALALQPSYPMALNNLGLVFLDLHRVEEALTCFDRALAGSPQFLEALSNRGTALTELKRFSEAAETFAQLAAAAPNFGGALGNLLHARRNCCDWRDYESLTGQVIAGVRRGELVDTPLSFLCTSDEPQTQKICAQSFVAARYPPRLPAVQPRWPYVHDRIRVAYLSGDFGAHAVSYLLAGVIERHDRSRFEILAIGWGRQNDGPMRTRLEAAFDRFIDASSLSDFEVATLLRELEVDIAVDLTGHTGGQRTEIFAHRGAPLQVNYLGFPGTMGAPYMDYLIADAIVVPPSDDGAYSECVVRLPQCYLPGDDRRQIAREAPARADAGLPESGFVFCAFNNPVKITPEVFGVWMGLLREVPGSVLWLRADAPEVRSNLLREAGRRGVEPARLVFAAATSSMESHLARHRLADLFLDTLPYNAHATACDALWAGLPVLTCRGRSFSGRVGASLLDTLGLPELIADNPARYTQLALELARDSARLATIRGRLEQLRDTSPAFDTLLYCGHLEAAYTTMQARLRDGLPPAAFAIDASSSVRGRL